MKAKERMVNLLKGKEKDRAAIRQEEIKQAKITRTIQITLTFIILIGLFLLILIKGNSLEGNNQMLVLAAIGVVIFIEIFTSFILPYIKKFLSKDKETSHSKSSKKDLDSELDRIRKEANR